MKDNITNEESLALITKMISTAKGNVSQSAFHMLLWGYVIASLGILHFLMQTYNFIEHPEMVWLLTIPTLIISLIAGYKRGRKALVRTHLDTLYAWVWMSFAVTMGLMIFFLAGKWDIVNPMVLMLAGYATFISGKLLRFKPMVYGAISFWVWALIAYFVGPYYGMLITSAGIITGYIIPGVLLQRKNNES